MIKFIKAYYKTLNNIIWNSLF